MSEINIESLLAQATKFLNTKEKTSSKSLLSDLSQAIGQVTQGIQVSAQKISELSSTIEKSESTLSELVDLVGQVTKAKELSTQEKTTDLKGEDKAGLNLNEAVRLASNWGSTLSNLGQSGEMVSGLLSGVNQSVNPESAVAKGAKDILGGLAAAETATNNKLSSKERHEGTREAARAGGKVATAAAGTVAYNILADGESGGLGVVGSANAYGVVNTANEMGGNFANQLGVNKIQQQLGLGDGTAYGALSDVATDAGTQLIGDKISDIGTELRGDLGTNYHEEIQLGAAGLSSGLSLAAGEAPDNIDKLSDTGAKVAAKYDLADEQTIKDLKTTGKSLQTGIDTLEGDLSAENLADIAEVSQDLADRAKEHDLIDEKTSKDVKAVSKVVETGATLSKGEWDPEKVSKISELSSELTDRAEQSEFISEETASSLHHMADALKSGADLSACVDSLPQSKDNKSTNEAFESLFNEQEHHYTPDADLHIESLKPKDKADFNSEKPSDLEPKLDDEAKEKATTAKNK